MQIKTQNMARHICCLWLLWFWALISHLISKSRFGTRFEHTRKQDAKWMLVHDQHISACLCADIRWWIKQRVCTKHISSRSRFCLFRRRAFCVCVYSESPSTHNHPVVRPVTPPRALRANFIFALDKADFAAVNKLALAKTSRWWRLRFWCAPHERVTGLDIEKKVRSLVADLHIPM